MTSLVIVESPTKARTIRDFLPKGYTVVASMGHIRDLPQSASEIPEKVKKEPWSQLGVNVQKDFEPFYVIPKDKKKVVTELKKLLKGTDELILATDEDREGESISWHLLEVLNPKVPVKRMVFHEITKDAISKSIDNCRDVDHSLVQAQETRRILDRLFGYTLSPLLWKKVAVGLSAGRVQSVSVRMIVLRERERRAFQKGSYWDLKVMLQKDGQSFGAILDTLGKQKIAKGSDFDENTGKVLKGKKVLLLDEKEARTLKSRLEDQDWFVKSVTEKNSTVKPAPPFITSTLQQEASRKLRLSPRKTMRIAQGLYEKGFITYMRTDSVQLSEQAIKAARKGVTSIYGKEFLHSTIRTFKGKTKGAQEAHEAIRPAGANFTHPGKADLDGQELALYDLIWKRTIATQMADAKQVHIKATIEVDEAEFQAKGKRISFPGFFRAYVEGSDDPDAALEGQEIILPDLTAKEKLKCQDLEAKGHETKPPGRYTEASLVKKLENEGIGRPSTYASIIDTIVNRGYVQITSQALVPSFTAFAVTNLMEQHFSDLVDPGFTAKMEGVLDEIAAGKTKRLPYMKKFFLGKNGLESKTVEKTDKILPGEFRTLQFDDLKAKVCIGRFGPYIETEKDSEGQKTTVSIPKDITPSDLDQEAVDLILMQQAKSSEEIGIHPETSEPVYLLHGTYGPYLQLGTVEEGKPKPKRVTLPKEIKEVEVDMPKALALLSLPRVIGVHPDTKGNISAGISRYGSYIVHDDPNNTKDYRSLKLEDSVIEISLERSLEILSVPKRSRKKAAEPVRELGNHPDDNSPINVFVGPYGPYVKHQKVNASIPKDVDIDKLTLDRALELLEKKAMGKKRKPARKAPAKKKTTKKAVKK
ncbi:MAG: type I DNA topoisomerase [Deltaproteobacteria bacterium]|jgi:DNA topoisomerase I|nr:type I DNA topoisomerase [Deltaproteobacteria bacterium]MBT4641836.1 type I DNA topoisomerase [Deltaproteobacteria bacterium]MBT6504577.1 type I DNA topoisomerase [Deltaproteobacteria bacterium]MBT6612191.1 type I DNA topoisomerase [Deltaproteobacteria bacterium]MBT7151194.1 type I DNA topoisomerase [Deltaproteobacteria bacterium]